METIDPAKAARVWQKVQANIPHPNREQGLPELLTQQWNDAATYLQLSRHFQGRQNVLLRRLFEEEQAQTACLKGIYTLLTGNRPKIATTPIPQEPPDLILRKCYGREMRCLAQYEQRSSDPEYGPVFARLAIQKRDHCRMVLELLGNMK